MKKLMFIAAGLLAVFAYAGPNDITMVQRNANDDANITRTLISPASNGLIYYNTSTLLPGYVTLGAGLSISNGVLSASSFSGAYADLTGIPSTFTPAAHNQAWTTITSTPTTISGYGITDASKAVVGTTVKYNSFRIYKSATVSSGVAVFHLTDDGTSTGNALYSEVFQDSVQPIVSDATASYQFSWAFSNSNKTLTVTANKLTTANILTGILGQAQANGAVVKLIVEGK